LRDRPPPASRCTVSDPDHVAALNNLAYPQRRAGCAAQARSSIDRALALAPRDSPLRPVLETTRDEIGAMPGDARCAAASGFD
jgi:hypothetical protein